MKHTYVLFVIIILVLAMTGAAYAGVWDTVQEHTVGGLLTLIFAAVAVIFGKKWAALKAPVQAIIAAIFDYQAAKRADSEEGSKVSKAEWNKIYEHLNEALAALLAVIPSSWLPAKKTG